MSCNLFRIAARRGAGILTTGASRAPKRTCATGTQNAARAQRGSAVESGTKTRGGIEDKKTATSTAIPDISSTSWTSFGFEEKDAKDPKRWTKFGIKYAGAVLLFLVSYQSLHWYVARLEKDGQRRKREMEENKEIARGFATKEEVGFADVGTQMKGTGGGGIMTGECTSEVEELKSYKALLERRMEDMNEQMRKGDEGKELAVELSEVINEIGRLEEKAAVL